MRPVLTRWRYSSSRQQVLFIASLRVIDANTSGVEINEVYVNRSNLSFFEFDSDHRLENDGMVLTADRYKEAFAELVEVLDYANQVDSSIYGSHRPPIAPFSTMAFHVRTIRR
jgi:hypothetical protein